MPSRRTSPAVAATPDHGSPPVPDLRTLLARAENHVDELQGNRGVAGTEPARASRAGSRAGARHPLQRPPLERAARSHPRAHGRVDQVNRDLLAERLGRVEDLELVVELLSAGIAAVREDVAEARADIGSIVGSVESVVTKLDQPIQVTLERTRQGGVRDLFRPTDSSAEDSGASAPSTTSG